MAAALLEAVPPEGPEAPVADWGRPSAVLAAASAAALTALVVAELLRAVAAWLRRPLSRAVPPSSPLRSARGPSVLFDLQVVEGRYPIAFLVLGTSVLFPLAAYVTSVDYFNERFKAIGMGQAFMFNVPNAFTPPQLVLLVLQAAVPQYFCSIRARVLFSYALYTLTLGLTVAVDRLGVSAWALYYSGLGLLVLGGVSAALLQGALFALAAQCGPREMQMVLIGMSTSSSLCGIMRLGLMTALRRVCPPSTQSLAFFLISIAVVIGSAVQFGVLLRDPAISSLANARPHAVNLREVPWAPVLPPGAAVVLSFLVTLNFFPGMVTAIRSGNNVPDDQFAVYLVSVHMIADTAGRLLSTVRKPTGTGAKEFGAALLRVPLFLWLICTAVVGRVVAPAVGDWYALVCSAQLAFTGGYVACRAVALAPAQVAPKWKAEAGTVTGLCIVTGLVLGSWSSLLWLGWIPGHQPH